MITVENQKMSKSLGNFFTVREVKEEYDLEVLRFFLLSAHYRSPINFSREVMDQTKNSLDRLYNCKNNLEYLLEKAEDIDELEAKDKIIKDIEKHKEEFCEAMDDDINTADAISSLFELTKYINTQFDDKTQKPILKYAYDTMMELSKVLGILDKRDEILEHEIIELIEKRTEARKNKDYQLADEIRDSLKGKGIILEDTSDGVKWKRV